MPDLSTLLEKLEAAERPIRYLGLDAFLMPLFGRIDSDDAQLLNAALEGDLNAALAVCERALPGFDWTLNIRNNGRHYVTAHWPDNSTRFLNGGGPTIVLALLSALIKAKMGSRDEG